MLIPILLFFAFLLLLAISLMLRLRARDSLSPTQRALLSLGAWSRVRFFILLVVLIIGVISLTFRLAPSYRVPWLPVIEVTAVVFLVGMMIANQRRLRKLDMPRPFLRATRTSNFLLLTALFDLWAVSYIRERAAVPYLLQRQQQKESAASKN